MVSGENWEGSEMPGWGIKKRRRLIKSGIIWQ